MVTSNVDIGGLLNISLPWQINAQEETAIISWRECSKMSVQQSRELLASSRRGQPLCDARSVHEVREHGKMAPCLREAAFSLRSSHFGEGGTAACAPELASAASAKAGNAAGLPAVALA